MVEQHTWLWPNASRTMPRIISAFGSRIHPITGKRAMHYATDFVGFEYNHSITDGVVEHIHPPAGWGGGGDPQIWVKNWDGSLAKYFHGKKDSALVKVGDHVRTGQGLSVMGRTGLADVVHLHLEISPYGGPNSQVDPVPWLAKKIAASPAGGGATPFDPKEDDMPKPIFREFQYASGRGLPAGGLALPQGKYTRLGSGGTPVNLASGTGGTGLYQTILHFYGLGLPVGETMDVRLVLRSAAKNTESPHYVGQLLGTKDGQFTQHVAFARPLTESSYLYLDAMPSVAGVKLTMWGVSVTNFPEKY